MSIHKEKDNPPLQDTVVAEAIEVVDAFDEYNKYEGQNTEDEGLSWERLDQAIETLRQRYTMLTKVPVQYVLVRKDLPVEVQAINIGHATAEAIRIAPIDKRTTLKLLHVADAAELLWFQLELMSKGYHVGLVREPNPPHYGAAMALATEPLTARVSGLGRLFYHLKPAKFPEATNGAQDVEDGVPELPGIPADPEISAREEP